ncbi:ABC transporter permease [Clostridium sp. MB40-C1]|uniref:ABC transporter permease n=1 Tax=Clostridium sp. MB40-C1 TaxID=3070996 RepID=UPI0027DFBD06|nr:ABC transporter permease [Clostridium sp. MB40-C1]WMJ79416.1 ABC transporter permease [Clostridium sp. MB40-C1]
MNTSLFTIYKIEMIKLIKRKDWLALLALVAISFMFGAAVLSSGYIGESNQSALYWVSTQIFNSSGILITPMIFAFICSRILASEIEDGSISLYTTRYRNRGRMYFAKNLATISFATITFIIVFIINIAIYYIFVCQNPTISSGKFLGNNIWALVIVLGAVYISSFILTTQFSLFLSAYLKPAPVIGIVFVIVLVFHNTFRVPYLQNINPWYYLIKLSDDVFSTTNQVVVNYSEKLNLFFAFILLNIIYIIIFNLLAVKKFKGSDLQ